MNPVTPAKVNNKSFDPQLSRRKQYEPSSPLTPAKVNNKSFDPQGVLITNKTGERIDVRPFSMLKNRSIAFDIMLHSSTATMKLRTEGESRGNFCLSFGKKLARVDILLDPKKDDVSRIIQASADRCLKELFNKEDMDELNSI